MKAIYYVNMLFIITKFGSPIVNNSLRYNYLGVVRESQHLYQN